MTQEFDEDQFDGFVSSNVKSKYDYFNDIQEEQQQSNPIISDLQNGNQKPAQNNFPQVIVNEEDFEFGDFHQQNDVVMPTLQINENFVPHLNLLPNPPQTGSQNHIQSSNIQKHDVFEFGEYVDIQTDNKKKVVEKHNYQQQFFAPPQPIHHQEQVQKESIANILDFDNQGTEIPQKTTNLMSLYDAFPPEENYTIISPTLELKQVDQAPKSTILPNLMQIYEQSFPKEVVQQEEIIQEEQFIPEPKKQDLFDFEEQSHQEPLHQEPPQQEKPQQETPPHQEPQPIQQIITEQQPQLQFQFLSLYQEQQNQNIQTQNEIPPNQQEVHEQEHQGEEDDFDEFVEGEQIELEQIEQQPISSQLFVQNPVIEQEEQSRIQQEVQSQELHKPNAQLNVFQNIQLNPKPKAQEKVQQQFQNFGQPNGSLKMFQQQPVKNEIIKPPQQPPSIITDLTMLQDIQFGPSGPHKSTPIEKRKWREQIEDIVGLDADCMAEYIKELEELKLDVYKQKVLEYAQLARDIQTLRKKKQYHVDREEYEEATVIRDTLRAKEPIAMQLKKKILEVAKVMDLMDGQDLDYHIKQYLYLQNEEFPQNPQLDLLLPKIKSTDFVVKLKKELQKSESVLSIIKLQGQLEKVRYEKKYQNFILGLRKIIGMSYRFEELNECVRAVNDRLSDLKLEKEIHRIDYEYIFENTMIPYLKGDGQGQYYCNYCFMAKKNLIEYKGKVYDVCCLNFYYNVN